MSQHDAAQKIVRLIPFHNKLIEVSHYLDATGVDSARRNALFLNALNDACSYKEDDPKKGLAHLHNHVLTEIKELVEVSEKALKRAEKTALKKYKRLRSRKNLTNLYGGGLDHAIYVSKLQEIDADLHVIASNFHKAEEDDFTTDVENVLDVIKNKNQLLVEIGNHTVELEKAKSSKNIESLTRAAVLVGIVTILVAISLAVPGVGENIGNSAKNAYHYFLPPTSSAPITSQIAKTATPQVAKKREN